MLPHEMLSVTDKCALAEVCKLRPLGLVVANEVGGTVTPIPSHIVCGHFCATMTKLNGCDAA